METEDPQETLLKYLGRFHLSMNMVKICARQCGLTQPDSSLTLSQQQTNCITKCSSNIHHTYNSFHQSFSNKKMFGEMEEEEHDDLFGEGHDDLFGEEHNDA